VLALALVHHLAISRNIPFGRLLDWLVDLAPRGIIEYVPKADPMVQRLLTLRPDIFPDYSYDTCLDRISRRCDRLKQLKLSPDGRVLLWYERSS
jgi:hypothetical protein